MSEAPVQITAHGEGWHDIPYIRADVCAERQNAIQSEVYAERMLADGLRKQLDAANARIAELEAAMVAINRLGSGVVTRRAAHLALQP